MSPTARRVTRLVTLALTAVTLAACGGAFSRPSHSQATLVVKNASSETIVTVNFPGCSDGSWGADRLDADETIGPGAQRSWQVAPGCYDVRAKASTGASVEWDDLEVSAGQATTFTAGSES